MNRNIVQNKNIFLGLTFKGLGIVLNLLLVPALLIYLSKEEYGVWVTVFSIVNWIFTFDLGIGHGLRNKLTEALSVEDIDKASALVSTAYVLIAAFAISILILGSVILMNTDLQEVLNYRTEKPEDLILFVLLALLFTVLNFVLSLYKKLYLAIHKSYVLELTNSIFLILFVGCVFFWNNMGWSKGLIGLILLFGTLNILISTFTTYIFFKTKNVIRISLKLYDPSLSKSLFGHGKGFFVINLCLIVILSTDNLIISNMLGPRDVTDYSVVQRVFGLLVLVFNVILSASWGLYTESLISRDYQWIQLNLKKMRWYLGGIMLVGVLFYLFIDRIVEIWLGEGVIELPEGLALLNLIYVIVFGFSNIYMYFINATGKIGLQMKLYLFGAIINIPASIYFVGLLGNSSGVLLATILSVLPLLFAMPAQTRFLLKGLRKA